MSARAPAAVTGGTPTAGKGETMRDDAEQPFTPDEAARMVAHMNDDHADSVLAYLRHFGGRPEATSGRLLDVGADAMRIEATVPDGVRETAVRFDHRLESARDAHMTMVKMSKQAKRALGWSK